MYYLHGYQVLGLESNPKNVKTAIERQKLYPDSQNYIKYICLNVNENSGDLIAKNLHDNFDINIDKICLIGLHSCADLSVNACKLFSKMTSASLLIMLSCCYHKLSLDNNNKFNNFPVSKMLKKIINNQNKFSEILNLPFLRLACQEPAARWEEMPENAHTQHEFYVLARAVLELFASQSK